MARQLQRPRQQNARAERFSAALAAILHELKLTHRELAAAVGVTAATVASWTGAAAPQVPAPANLARLCAVLELRKAGASEALQRVLRDQSAPAAAPLRAASIGSLPAPVHACIGRERELADIAAHFTGHRGGARQRLLTLIGAGGVGKTRLAIEAGHVLQSSYPDGVWLIELAALNEPAALPATVAAVLNLAIPDTAQISALLAARMEHKAALLIIDNCEHLAQACAALITTLLSACPRMHVLATSRQVLHVNGERVHRVPSLSTPQPNDDIDSARNALQYESVRLFADRASGIDHGFALSEANSRDIATICRRLDGIPLAIELAAAKVLHLSPREIADGLDNRFGLLTRGWRSSLPRQQTLRATLDWSYSLMTEREQLLFDLLAVFSGGADLDTLCSYIDQLQGLHDIAHGDTPALLASLADKSLLVAQHNDGRTRYHMLETMRDYARERLAARGELEPRARAAHMMVFTNLAELAGPHLTTSRQVEWLRRLAVDLENLRVALSHCASNPGQQQTGLRLAAALGWFWSVSAREREGIRWLERFLAPVNATDADAVALRAQAVFFAGFLSWYMSDYDNARIHLGQYVRQNPGNVAHVELARILDCHIDLIQERLSAQQALSRMEAGIATVRETGDDWVLSIMLGRAGSVAIKLCEYDAALRYYEESYHVRKRAGLTRILAGSLTNLGLIAIHKGDYDAAIRYTELAIDYGRRFDSEEAAWVARINVGFIQYKQGRLHEAMRTFHDGLTAFRRLGNREHIIGLLAEISYTGAAVRVSRSTAVLCSALDRQMAHYQGTLWDLDSAEMDLALARVRAALDPEVHASAWAEGQSLTLEQSIEHALAYSADMLAAGAQAATPRHPASATT